jgi:hypothetical protein
VGISTAVSLDMSLINDPGDTVAGGQVDVVFDSDVMTLIGVTAGTAATSAGKSVSYSALERGVVRLIVAGMNLNAIGDGDLAQFEFVLAGGMPGGDYAIDLDGLVLSNAYGMAVASAAAPSVINVTALPVPVRWWWVAGLVLLTIGTRGIMQSGHSKCALTN